MSRPGALMPSTIRPMPLSVSARSSGFPSIGAKSRSQESGAFTSSPSSELLQEPDVVLEERLDVLDAVADHGHPLQPESEGEAGVGLGVVADGPEHVGVDHSAAAQLQPARLGADRAAGAVADEARHLELGARLGERE